MKEGSGEKAKNKPDPKKELKVNDEWTIHYVVYTFKPSDFVSAIPEEGITLEELRQGMEKEYFAMTKQRTKWSVDEKKKHLYPDVSGTTKGSSFLGRLRKYYWKKSHLNQEVDPRPKSILASADGKLYEINRSFIGEMTTPVTGLLPDLDRIEPGFSLQLPKIPIDHLSEILSFFQYFCKQGFETEVMVMIYWDKEKQQYVNICPKQTVSKTRVWVEDFEQDLLNQSEKRYEPVMHIHSHNSMPAFFSSIDDADEVAPLLYGVVGEVHKQPSQIRVRAGFNGAFINLVLTDVFDMNNHVTNTTSFPKEWINQLGAGE
ncbi:Mov34/MPN/PAD-1 family protein [Alkalihalophilus marmarensis]|uniref:Mov34/MPN/PAD-1 family protein n=1 Tax=Alkalihalophilus marmarensis TaxID=521377 RepID=UPI002DBBBF8A|nr:Mov34/MPN/PAD-1 family protein [Alkalihalophilus marmarensis]MEC2074218.1 Mov34/MPN/PAD-1 family protein [Alkalihalophilus marmarensis]